MALAFEATIGGTTYSLNDGNPFYFAGIEGVGPSGVLRHGQSGPLQSGVTDLGYRLQPRTIALSLHFYAATDAALDAHRDTLMDIFKPLDSLPIALRVTRDDSEIRTLDCFAMGDIDIALVPENRPGHLHRATVRLRAADPVWKKAESTTTTYSGSGTAWWLAGGSISASNVLEAYEYPEQGQEWGAWGFGYPNIGANSSWTVVFRSGQELGSGSKTAFRSGTTESNHDPQFRWAFSGWGFGETTGKWSGTMLPGTQNYMVVFTEGSDTTQLYNGTTLLYTDIVFFDRAIWSNQPAYWRGVPFFGTTTYWPSEMPKVAAYNIALSSAQKAALDDTMAGGVVSTGTVTVVNDGDLPEYPYITIHGPIADPVITNVSTGDVIDLTGFNVSSQDICYIDLRDGGKSIVDINGNNVMNVADSPIGIAGWHLAPSPAVAGGTNTIRIEGEDITSDTQVSFLYHNRYMSF